MKTILIPTDYQPDALKCIQGITNQVRGEGINLVFVHMFKLSDSENDLLMLSRRSREYERVSDEFYKQLRDIRAQNPQIYNVKLEFLYGSTLGMFRNFLDANEVDMILESESCSFGAIHKSSINPDVLVQKSGLPVLKLNKKQAHVQEQPAGEHVYETEEILTEA
ncbi:hypothetical protein DYU05_10290 [Mucilaginibacter terrenus]|uniref:Universal stress protein n=1 Tax=Mucilaginibacter terrenus TaxID=2482727 RepID=A0A3E2NY47_9SPHI|nr:hypothetical protein [Mucilaginibacter terrenus]RFZ85948.1 hypothetical protein DYU05_10290 [Mucilaginibacter terrenus]